jgi:hypothetical protein
VITKKWVDLKIAAEKEERKADLSIVLDQLGWAKVADNLTSHYVPKISMAQRLDAICAYLGIEIAKESKEEKIVARKIKKAK